MKVKATTVIVKTAVIIAMEVVAAAAEGGTSKSGRVLSTNPIEAMGSCDHLHRGATNNKLSVFWKS